MFSTVSPTSGRLAINSWMLAFLAAAMISSIGTSRELSPYAMFSRIVLSNSTGSWDTIPICARSDWTLIVFKSKLSKIYKHKSEVLMNRKYFGNLWLNTFCFCQQNYKAVTEKNIYISPISLRSRTGAVGGQNNFHIYLRKLQRSLCLKYYWMFFLVYMKS